MFKSRNLFRSSRPDPEIVYDDSQPQEEMIVPALRVADELCTTPEGMEARDAFFEDIGLEVEQLLLPETPPT